MPKAASQTFEAACRDQARQIAELVVAKQRDYGTDGILHTPLIPILQQRGVAESLAVEIGILNRLHDKVARLIHLYACQTPPENESVEDSWRDVMGYALLALMTREGTFSLPLTTPATPTKTPQIPTEKAQREAPLEENAAARSREGARREKSPIVYLAGPIAGCDYVEAVGWRGYLAGLLQKHGIRSINPMRFKEHLSKAALLDCGANSEAPTTQEAFLVERDLRDIRTCDCVVAFLLDGGHRSIGTLFELGYAHARGIPVVLIAEPEIGRHVFLHRCAVACSPTVEQAADVIARFLRKA